MIKLLSWTTRISMSKKVQDPDFSWIGFLLRSDSHGISHYVITINSNSTMSGDLISRLPRNRSQNDGYNVSI